MTRTLAGLFSLVVLVSLFTVTASAQNAPVLFFSDMTSGPVTGNSDTTYSSTGGLYVTLYGNFLTSLQSANLNGVPCITPVSSPSPWLWYQRMVVELGAKCTSGNITVTTPSGTSNGIGFTVRSGNIYYVAQGGSDSNSGTFGSPWRTLLHARGTMVPGDVVYGENGVSASSDDGSGWATCFLLDSNSGTAGNPKTIAAYPGATVTIGSPTACNFSVRSKGNGNHYWNFAELTFIGISTTVNPYSDHDWRLIGNDMSCPNGNTQLGCLDIGGDLNGTEFNYWVYGNNIHNAGTNNSPTAVTALYHGVYLSQQIHGLQFGWNTVANVYGGRCIQENVNANNSMDDQSSYDLHIHDNLIHDCQDDGIVMTTINPSLGTVELYNNVIYNAGQGPSNAENSGKWSCLDLQGWMNVGLTGESGVAQVYNNTMFACGTFATPPYSRTNAGFYWEDGNTTTKGIVFQNNIVYLTTGPALGFPYVISNRAAALTGSNNIFFGNGTTLTCPNSACLNSLTNSLFADPLFGNPSADNLTLQVGSPAIGFGSRNAPIPVYDIQGLLRPISVSAGAYEFAPGTSVAAPDPPTNLTIAVQ